MSRASRFFAAAAAVLFTSLAAAQEYPSRPVTMVVPFAAGGAVDVIARILAPSLGQNLGQQVVVENVGGSGGMIGSSRVAKSAPDGYHMVLGTIGTHAQNQTLYKRPLYDAVADFAPVALVARQPVALVARRDLPPSNLTEFISYARANMDRMQFASAGAGSAGHLACVL